MAAECPENSIHYNTMGCFCSPGYYYYSAQAICSLFSLPPGGEVMEHSAVGNNPEFLLKIFPFDSISKQGQKSYPLRPELIESTYWLYKATGDPRYLDVGRDIVASLQYGALCPCGYCHIEDVETHKKEDHMESFFLAETVKYLWLLFDLATGPSNIIENGPYRYVFSTEGHFLPATPEISLAEEHCSYYGSFCKQDGGNGSRYEGLNPKAYPLHRRTEKFTSKSAFIKGQCPGLSHGQKFGISYITLSEQTLESEVNEETVDETVSPRNPVLLENPTLQYLPKSSVNK